MAQGILDWCVLGNSLAVLDIFKDACLGRGQINFLTTVNKGHRLPVRQRLDELVGQEARLVTRGVS